ncbi:MAG: aminopeptidase P family protein [Aquificae bacterium]|nr:aminopeptidase P family protein [Aquificota bacterium]
MPKINEIQKYIEEKNLSSFLFSSFSNIFYLSRFSSSNAYILLTPKEKLFITDFRYFEGAKEKLKDWKVILLGKDNKEHLKHLQEILLEFGGKHIGFEKDKVSLSFYEKLTEKKELKERLIGFEGFINEFRMIKTEEEIEIIRKAVEKTDNIFSKIIEYIPKAKSELDIRRMIINYIFEEGGTGESFPAIVASGKHSAIPHYETSDYPIEKNNLLLIDMGMKYKGYCSDFTRTIAINKVDKELIKIYSIVKEAHLTAVETVKAGVKIKEIDLAARKVIEKYGYGDYFIHSTGHGIGIDIHEPPRISKNNEGFLEENTVFTIEPGIYIPGKGGVRLENVVVARKNKGEVLTKTPLDLITIEG